MTTHVSVLLRGALTAIVAVVITVDPLGAQSFDCRKAGTPLERQICADPTLGAADNSLDQAWRAAIATFPVPSLLRLSQRYWIKGLSGCLTAGPGACLRDYRERIQFLREIGLAKVFTKEPGAVSPEAIYLTFYRTAGGPALWVFGGWMPDMNTPKPPPEGWLYDNIYELRAETGNQYRIIDLDAVMRLTVEQVVFPEYTMITPRQGGLGGSYKVMR
jgi:hypothetical protein